MKISTTTKLFIAAFSMASVVVTAGTFSDMQFNSNSFMNDTEMEVVKRLDDNTRNISSVIEATPSVLDIEMTEANIKRINGTWNIYNIVGDEEKVNFNAKFELIGRGEVRVGGEQVYKISFLTNSNTIALFKDMGEGKYEIIEARKVVSKDQMNKIAVQQKMMAQEGLTVNAQEIDLNINAGSTQVAGKYAGKAASGSIRISNGQIVNFEMFLAGEHALSFTEAVEIGDGGAFVTTANIGSSTETISGIIINSGNNTYSLRIATGEFQGTTLVFDSASQKVDNYAQAEVPAEQVQAEVAPAPVVEQTEAEVAPAPSAEEAARIQENTAKERQALMAAMDAQNAEVAPAEAPGFNLTSN